MAFKDFLTKFDMKVAIECSGPDCHFHSVPPHTYQTPQNNYICHVESVITTWTIINYQYINV